MSPSQHMTEIKGIQIKKDGRTLWNGFYCRQMVLKKILNQIGDIYLILSHIAVL